MLFPETLCKWQPESFISQQSREERGKKRTASSSRDLTETPLSSTVFPPLCLIILLREGRWKEESSLSYHRICIYLKRQIKFIFLIAFNEEQ